MQMLHCGGVVEATGVDEAAAGSVVRVSYVASLMGSGQRIGGVCL